MSSMFKHIIISIVIIYRHSFGLFFPQNCRFHPTCSAYMVDSVKKHGALRGVCFGVSRILRCNPFSSKSGLDPVE